MAYNEELAERIRVAFLKQSIHPEEKKMMGGLCFMVDDKMCCGIHFDKNRQSNLLLARVGEKAAAEALKRPEAHPMDFTGRPMKGFIFIDSNGFEREEDLDYWVNLCLTYNPEAKKSKKKK